jgi:hypothetical protein
MILLAAALYRFHQLVDEKRNLVACVISNFSSQFRGKMMRVAFF